MPLNETPLPAATIAAISQWIANGAPNVPATTAAAKRVFAMKDGFPPDGSILEVPPSQMQLTFSGEIDASLVNGTTVTLTRVAGPDLDATDTPVAVDREVVAANPSVLVLKPHRALIPGAYRLNVRATGGGGLADVNATALDSDAALLFTVDSSR